MTVPQPNAPTSAMITYGHGECPVIHQKRPATIVARMVIVTSAMKNSSSNGSRRDMASRITGNSRVSASP